MLVHGDDGSEFVVSNIGPRGMRVTPNDVPVAGDRIWVWYFDDGWTLAQTTRRTAATLARSAAMTAPGSQPVHAAYPTAPRDTHATTSPHRAAAPDPGARPDAKPAPMPWEEERTPSVPRGSAPRRQASPGATPRPRTAQAPSMSAEFERLAELHRQGILTDAEFAQAKRHVLER